MINITQLRDELESFKLELINELVDALTKRCQKHTETKINEYASIKEAADFFGKSRVTINTWIKNGYIHSIKKGNQRLFLRSDLEDFKQNNLNYLERLQMNKFR